MNEFNPVSQNVDPAEQRIRALVATLRHIGAPLAVAVSEVQSMNVQAGTAASAGAPQAEAEMLGRLVDSVVTASQSIAAEVGAKDQPIDDWVRWAVVGAASQCVASRFRATGTPPDAKETETLIQSLVAAQSKFRNMGAPLPREKPINSSAAFYAKMVEAMSPVVGAVAQYSFGRAEHALLAEIAERILKTSDQVTRALATGDAKPEEWRMLCWSVMRSAGQLYAEAHYAESDRLLYMDAEEREAYFAKNNNQIPMNRVWQGFDQRMAMLTTLAAYLEVPETARLDVSDWD